MIEEFERVIKGLAEEYLVKVKSSKRLMVKLARGEVSIVQSWNTIDLQVYLAKNGKMGVASLQAETVGDAVKRLPKALDMLSPSPLYAPLPEPNGKPISTRCGKVSEVVATGEVGEVLGELRVAELGDTAGMIEFEYWNTSLKGSSGVDLSYEGTRFNGYIRVFRSGRSGQWAWTSTSYKPELALKAIKTAERLAEDSSKLPRGKVEPGNYRVLLSPMIVGNLVGRIAYAASAFSAIMGLSFFQDKSIGEKVVNEEFTLYDKPLDTGLPGFRGFDDEGVMTRDKPVIERGVFKGFLHNSKTAKLFNTESTGNAGWIAPTPFNLEVSQGDLKDEELYDTLKDGLYLTNNWYTRFQNYLEGEFSTVTRDAAFIVKNGEPKAYVERVRIADKILRVFSNVEAATRDRWQIQWWEVTIPSRIPHLLISDVKISLPE